MVFLQKKRCSANASIMYIESYRNLSDAIGHPTTWNSTYIEHFLLLFYKHQQILSEPHGA